MKKWNIIGAGIIMLCTVIISYWHSFELFDSSAAYSECFSHFGVVAVETLFLLSGGNIVYSAATGRPPIKSAKIGFWIGSVFVGWSNVAAAIEPEVMEIIYRYVQPVFLITVKGVLLGVVPPVSLLVSERIFTESILQPASQKVAEVVSQMKEQTDQPASQKATKTRPIIQAVERSANHLGENQPTSRSTNQQPASQSTKQTTTGQPVADQPATIDQPTNQTAKDNQPEPTTQPDESVNQPTSKQPAKTAKTTNRVARSTIQPTGKLVEEAEKYWSENGKWPSERKLAELVGTSRHQAGKVLKQLKSNQSTSQPDDSRSAKANG